MSAATVDPMARKSVRAKGGGQAAKGKPAEVGAPESAGRKPMVVQIRGSEEYKAWADSVAKRKGFSLAVLFDQALRSFVGNEFGQPPER